MRLFPILLLLSFTLRAQPTITTQLRNGVVRAVVLHASDLSQVTDDSPAQPGETLILQGSGFGADVQVFAGASAADYHGHRRRQCAVHTAGWRGRRLPRHRSAFGRRSQQCRHAARRGPRRFHATHCRRSSGSRVDHSGDRRGRRPRDRNRGSCRQPAGDLCAAFRHRRRRLRRRWRWPAQARSSAISRRRFRRGR